MNIQQAAPNEEINQITTKLHSLNMLEGNIIENDNNLSKKFNFAAPLAEESIQELIQQSYSLNQLDELAQYLYCNDIQKVHLAIIGICKILGNTDNNPPIAKVISLGILPTVVNIALQNQYPTLKNRTIWIMSNIASGSPEETQTILNLGAQKIFLQNLSSGNDDLIQNCLYGIGNIVCHNPNVRTSLFNQGLQKILLYLICSTASKNIISSSLWVISNSIRSIFFFNKAFPNFTQFENIQNIIFCLGNQLKLEISNHEKQDVLWALSHLTSNGNSTSECIKYLIDTGAVPVILTLLNSTNIEITIPSLRICGNISADVEIYAQELINSGYLICLQNLIKTTNRKTIIRQIWWNLSNLAADDLAWEAVYQNQFFINKMFQNLYSPNTQIKVLQQLLYVLKNPISKNNKYKQKLATAEFYRERKVISVLLQLLKQHHNNVKIMQLCLDGINMLLKAGKKYSGVSVWTQKVQLQQSNGIDFLCELRQNTDYDKVNNLIDKIINTCNEKTIKASIDQEFIF